MPKPTATSAGIVRPGELLTINAAKRALQVEDWGWRKLCEQGVPVMTQGRQKYVLSDDLISHFARLRDEQEK